MKSISNLKAIFIRTCLSVTFSFCSYKKLKIQENIMFVCLEIEILLIADFNLPLTIIFVMKLIIIGCIPSQSSWLIRSVKEVGRFSSARISNQLSPNWLINVQFMSYSKCSNWRRISKLLKNFCCIFTSCYVFGGGKFNQNCFTDL